MKVDLRRRQAGQRVGHHDEPEIRHAPQFGHFLSRCDEGIRHNRYGWDAHFFEDNGVKQTARRTRASITDPGNSEIYLFF